MTLAFVAGSGSFPDETAIVGPVEPACPIAEKLRVHPAVAEYIVKGVMQRPLRLASLDCTGLAACRVPQSPQHP